MEKERKGRVSRASVRKAVKREAVSVSKVYHLRQV